MKVTVNSPKTPVTKGSNGIAAATVPNVCKMPGPPAPFVPTPLPNIGKSSDSPKGYTKKVKVTGKPAAIKGSTFTSTGDVASKGTGGGLVSSNTHGPTKFVGPGSFDVKFEGKNVQFLGDPMLNNCGGSGNPPNSATLLGVLQGPLLVVVEGGEQCPVCEEAPHGDLEETEATNNDAAALEGSLKGAGFAPREISMLAVAHCQCGKDKAAARSSMRRSGEFSSAASGYITPAYVDYKGAKEVLAKIREVATNAQLADDQIALAGQRRQAFEQLPKATKANAPQVNVPGTCAAPRAMLLIIENDGLPGAITERWCGGGAMGNPVSHIQVVDGARTRVDDHVFGQGDSVPPCLACDALLPLLLCTKDKMCH